MQGVGNSEAAKASKNSSVQQLSTSSLQQVQYQSVGSKGLQQVSIGSRMWFGTRGRPLGAAMRTCGVSKILVMQEVWKKGVPSVDYYAILPRSRPPAVPNAIFKLIMAYKIL